MNTITFLQMLIFLATTKNGFGLYKWQMHSQLERKDMEPTNSFRDVSSVETGTQCAILCMEIDGICGYFYNVNGRCLCSFTLQRPLQLLLTSPGFMYYLLDACQLGGYFQLEHGLCVKQYEVDLPYAFAQEYCNDESGRLVRIDTLSKYYSLRDHLIAYTTRNYAVYYIEGIRQNGKFVFTDNSEVPSTAIVWAEFEPHADECLSLFTVNFKHGDTLCSGSVWGFNFGFVCERVI